MIDTKALRAKILDLAMRGKLVPQNPNDEPASELLKRIKEEKEELIKQKKMKRDKNETEIFRSDDGSYYEKFADGMVEKIDVPYEIPKGWAWTNLSSLFTMQAGKFIKASEILSEPDDYTYPVYGGNGLRGYADKYNQEGTHSLIGRQGARAGNINSVSGQFYATEHAIVVYPYGHVNAEWIFYWLTGLNLEQYQTGTAQPGLSVVTLSSVLIPVPSIQEQDRILIELGKGNQLLDTIDNEQKTLQSLANQLKKKVLDVAMQGKLVPQDPNEEPASILLAKIRAEKQKLYKQGKLKKKDLEETTIIKDEDNAYYEKLPSNWQISSIKTITRLVTKGTTPKGGQSAFQPTGIPFIRAENIVGGVVNLNTLNFIEESVHNGYLKRSKILSSDILVTIAGTLGRVGVVPKIDHGVNTNQAVSISRLVSPALINPEFIALCLETSRVQQSFKETSKTSAIPNLTLEIIANTILPIAPLKEQQRIVSTIEQVNLQLHRF